MPSPSRQKRVYRREWKLHTRSIRGSVSLPRLHLISSSRPWFECPSCYSCNDRVPVCLWCKSTSTESAGAFWESMPKQRTISAPMKVTWNYIPMTPTTGGVPRSTKSAEMVSRPRSRTTPSMHSISSHSASRVNKSNMLPSSAFTSTMITTEAVTIQTNTIVDEIDRMPCVDLDNNTSQPKTGQFNTLPLRRKGHILRTTAGMVVNKTRLSALFRKDAVPVLDKIVPAPESPRVKSEKTNKLRISTNLNLGKPRSARQKEEIIVNAQPNLPTIPDSSVVTTPNAQVLDTSYTTPTPPSFLSPFWYRPEEYGRLPATAAASTRSASVKASAPVKTSGSVTPRSRHIHTRSEPISQSEPTPDDASPSSWKRRMSGFFRHSISVMVGNKAIH